jgi:ubiquinone/menaquinone biosynthesis C-methylase UbiE
MDPRKIVTDAYDKIAETYDDWAPRVRIEERIRYTQVIIDALPQGSTVLELGCGAGGVTSQQLASGFTLTGVDISARQIMLARQRIPHATFIQADMTTLTFPPSSFDGIVAFYSIIHVPREEQPRLLDTIATWLRPGGIFVATLGARSVQAEYEPNWLGAPMYWSSYDTDTNRRMMAATGLRIVEANEEVADEDGELVTFLWVVARKES